MSTIVTPPRKSAHPLDGARERLKRADENIRNLEVEVSQFLSGFPKVIATRGPDNKAILTDDHRKAFEILRQIVVGRTEVPRFGVLAGEIVHHFRSAFDHLIWQLADAEGRRRFANEIEFPICETRQECIRKADGKVKHSSFCRKVQGVSSLTALARIHGLQPYHRVDLFNHPLLQIHLLDKFDKHRELVGVNQDLFQRFMYSGRQPFGTVKDSASGGIRIVKPIGPLEVNMQAELSLNISFAELRKWEAKPLLVLLKELLSFTSDAVESFADEFR